MIQVTYLMTIHKVFGMARIKVSYNVGMVFGVFDGLHQGHKHFLQAAAKRCKQLIVVVTVPAVVSVLKKHKPRYGYAKRVAAIRLWQPKYTLVPSDKTIGKWQILKKYTPDVVFLGYDQRMMAKELRWIHFPFVLLDAYQPKKYKSSILHNTAKKS